MIAGTERTTKDGGYHPHHQLPKVTTMKFMNLRHWLLTYGLLLYCISGIALQVIRLTTGAT